jgi:D-alanyl-lipoteichoic acid acyltransferase DltB (MBOAT superfamily)
MMFNALEFPLFLLLALGVHTALPVGARVPWLALVSLLFYGLCGWAAVPVLLGVLGVSYGAGLALGRVRSDTQRAWILGAALTAQLGLLGVFRYTDALDHLGLALPLGISFYVFTGVGYCIDVWSGEADAERDFWRYATFLAFFPKLVAGPLVRAHELLPQLAAPPTRDVETFRRALKLFFRGLLKKALVADLLSLTAVEPIFGAPGRYDTVTLWVGLLAFAVQVYTDFSGYTDMARAVAMLFGYDLPENFRLPYLAGNFTDFWNRWHITLSAWLKAYVFFPLSMAAQRRAVRRAAPGTRPGASPWPLVTNLMILFVAVGLWHGAAARFVVFGVIHGAAVAAHAVYLQRTNTPDWQARRRRAGWRVGCTALTFLLVTLTLVLFRAEDLTAAGTYYAGLFTPTTGERLVHLAPVALVPAFAAVTIAAGVFDLPALAARVPWPLRAVGYVGAALALAFLAPYASVGLIYGQF